MAAASGLDRVRRGEVVRNGDSRDIGVAAAVHGDAVALVGTAAAEVGRVEEGGAGRIHLRHEGIAEGVDRGLDRVRRGEVGRKGASRDIGVAAAVHGDAADGQTEAAEAVFEIAAAEVGRVEEGGAGRIHLRHEGIDHAAERGLDRVHRGEVGRRGESRDIGVAAAVHGDAEAPVFGAAAEVGRVEEGGAGRIHLRHEGIEVAAASGLDRVRRGEVVRNGDSRDIGVAAAVHRDPEGQVVAAAAQVRGVNQHRVDDKGLASVIRPEFEGHFVLPAKGELAFDVRCPLPVVSRRLINGGLVEPHLSERRI